MPRLFLLLLLLPVFASAQFSGQYELRKRNVNGTYTSYGVTLSNGQVIGLTAGVPAAITPLVSGDLTPYLTSATAATTYEPIITAGTTGQYWRGDKSWQTLNATAVGLGNVSNALQLVAANNLSDLASASTARTNLGLGAAALLATSAGGVGGADAGLVPVFGAQGQLVATQIIAQNPAAATQQGVLDFNGLTFVKHGGTLFDHIITGAALTATRYHELPNHSGTFLNTGSIIALTQLAQTSATNGQALAWNGTAWAPATISTGLTINTTTTSGASSGDILTSDGTLLQKLTPGTGVSTWLATPTLANLNSAVSDADLAQLGANTFTAAQTIASGTLAASAPGLNVTQTWNNAAVQFKAARIAITQTAYSSGIGTESYLQEWLGGVAGTTQKAFIDYNGGFSASGYGLDTSPSSGGGWVGMKSPGECAAFYANGTAIGAFGWFDGATNYRLVMRSDAKIGFAPSWALAYVGPDAFITREAAAIIQAGMDTNGNAVDQTLKAADGITGTDRSGGDYHFKSGLGTGAGAVSALIFSTPTVLTSGTTAQSYTERLRINSSGVAIGPTGTAIASVKRSSVTLIAGTATVSDTDTTANTVVLMSVITPGGTVGTLDYDVSAGTSYTINSSSILDTSTINITVIHFP